MSKNFYRYTKKEGEREYLSRESNDPKIKELVEELNKLGFGVAAERFYVSDGDPYFVITAEYAKEDEGDPDTVNMWIDVSSTEYTVTLQNGMHCHYSSAKEAAEMTYYYCVGTLSEYLLKLPGYTLGMLNKAEKDLEKIKELLDEMEPVFIETLEKFAPQIPEYAHHGHFTVPCNGAGWYVWCAKEKNEPIGKSAAYFVTCIFGEQAEYFLLGE